MAWENFRTGDYLTQHFRAGLCSRIEQFAIADETGQTFEHSPHDSGESKIPRLPRSRSNMSGFSPRSVVVSMEPHRMPVIEVALGRGAHVVAEKPDALTLAHFEKLAQLAAAGNRQLMLSWPRASIPMPCGRER